MKCYICKSEAHKAIDCPLSWYGRPATHSEDGSSPEQPSAGRPDVNNLTNDNTQPETTPAEEDTPVTIVETDPLAPAILSKEPDQSLLNSQGLFNLTPQPSDLPERPMTVQPSSVFSSLVRDRMRWKTRMRKTRMRKTPMKMQILAFSNDPHWSQLLSKSLKLHGRKSAVGILQDHFI